MQGEDFEFLNQDESSLDLTFLKQFLARNMNSNKLVQDLKDEIKRLKLQAQE